MPSQHHNDPLHGVTLQSILESLVDRFGWKALSRIIEIRCFYKDPSVKSSLKFLRKTPWAREKVEQLYIKECRGKSAKRPAEAPKSDDVPWYERRRLRDENGPSSK